ncbi:MAG TPA: hypothetical protein EYN66_09710 [Myxococcales bacterium]|nr:hypothetical protein [Myxococcales bacterium]
MVSYKSIIWLVVCVGLVACQVVDVDTQSKERVVNPAATVIQLKLFEAAEKGDVHKFEALLSQRSVALLEQHFEVMAGLPRPSGESAYGWEQLLKLFAQLPPGARVRTPFVVIQEDGQAKLDLSTHPDATLFSEIARGFQGSQ